MSLHFLWILFERLCEFLGNFNKSHKHLVEEHGANESECAFHENHIQILIFIHMNMQNDE